MTIEYEIIPKDFGAYSKYVYRGNTKILLVLLILILALLIVLLFFFGKDPFMHQHYHLPHDLKGWLLLILPLVFIFGLFIVFVRYYNKQLVKAFEGGVRITVEEDGIRHASRMGETKSPWASFIAIGESKDHYFLMMEKIVGIIVPKRAFESGDQMKRFYEAIRQHLPES